jgi:23S rRNA (guanosine2251-2'-O)-methyltransferase
LGVFCFLFGENALASTRLVFGFHAIQTLLKQRPESIQHLWVDSQRRDARMQKLCEFAESVAQTPQRINNDRLDRMVPNEPHQGVIAEVRDVAMPAVDLDTLLDQLITPPLLLILDGVQDPHNLGACLRNADALGADAVIIPKDRCAPLTPSARKVASGAAETVPLIMVTNLATTLRNLKERGIWVVGTAGDAPESLFTANLTGPIAWVLGSEGEGLRRLTRDNCDRLIRIPMFGEVESMNVSVTAGICLYATQQQRQPKNATIHTGK